MPTPVRESIIAAIVTAVGGQYDVPAPEDERDLPLTVVADDVEVALESSYGEHRLSMPIAIARASESTTIDRNLLRQQANAQLADIITEMFADETFGGLAEGVDYTGGGIETEVGKFVFAEARFNVRYSYQHGDPYTSN